MYRTERASRRMCEAFPVRFSVGSSCKTRQVRRRKDKERSAVDVTAWLTRSLLYMARVVPSSSSSNCECCAAVPKRRRVQAACRSCVPKLCQIITPVPEDLRTTNILSLERPSAPMAGRLHRLSEPSRTSPTSPTSRVCCRPSLRLDSSRVLPRHFTTCSLPAIGNSR